MIDVKHLTKPYGTRFNQTKVLDNLSFPLDQGEFGGDHGTKWCRKDDTDEYPLLHLTSESRFCCIGGKEITRLSENELSDFRRKEIGFIFQDFNLLDTLTAKDNIILPLAIDRLSVNEVDRRLAYLANLLGIAHLLDRYPEELSVGQKQRVAAARAIIQPSFRVFCR